jgi:molybdopterin molybdotransferase
MVDCCTQPGLLALEDALARIQQQLTPVQQHELVALPLTLDRVLAEPVIAAINVPSADNSAMDGYAVRAADCSEENNTLQLIGQALAGHPFKRETGAELRAGETVRIMTGAIIPEGADAVVMQENTRAKDSLVSIQQSLRVGENIRRAGEDIKQGAQVFAQGRRICALDIGLLASLGIAHVKVYRPLRVAIFSTGDELLANGAAFEAGKIYDSNRPLLVALLQRLAVEVKDLGIVPDNMDALRTAFEQASNWGDVVISTGGVSVGDADYTKDVLAEMGSIDFWKIAMKPGKPFSFGRLGSGWFFGLPGNPVSTAVTYHQLVVPGLRKLAGEVLTEKDAPLRLQATVQQPLKKQPGRVDFQRAIYTYHAGDKNGESQVRSAGMQSSGVLTGMSNANCYIYLNAERGAVAQGESVTVIPFDRYIG